MKAVLVIDVPEEYMGSVVDVKLYGKEKVVHEHYVNKLRLLPKKKVGNDLYERYGSWALSDEKEASYRAGFNDCLDAIAGGAE